MNPQVELAKQRNRIAADRTLLAWIRTSLILIGIGFGTENVVQAIIGAGVELPQSGLLAKIVELALVALGTYAIFSAALDYRQEFYRLQQNEYHYISRRSFSTTVAIILMLVATVILVRIFL